MQHNRDVVSFAHHVPPYSRRHPDFPNRATGQRRIDNELRIDVRIVSRRSRIGTRHHVPDEPVRMLGLGRREQRRAGQHVAQCGELDEQYFHVFAARGPSLRRALIGHSPIARLKKMTRAEFLFAENDIFH